MANQTEKRDAKNYLEGAKKTLDILFAEAIKAADNGPAKRGYDTSHLEKVKALIAQPAIDSAAEQYSELLDDLQANILKHNNKNHTEYLFLSFDANNSPQSVREWLSNFARHITTAKHQLEKGHIEDESIVCLYLTYSGYRFIGVPEPVIPQSLAFRAGANQRIRLSADVQKELSGDPEIHAIILYAYNHDPEGERQLLAKFGDELGELSETGMHFERGGSKNPLPEEYHFKEGIGNPHFFPGAPPRGKRVAVKYADIAPLDLVLAKDPGGNLPLSYGSYGAFLKLRINEAAISALETEILDKTREFPFEFDAEMARASIIGRFTDGTPLTLSEKQDRATDDFDYSEFVRVKRTSRVQDDRAGVRCPFHAHIRKANPRNYGEKDIRIVRRGVFYKDDDSDKGLLFLSFQRSLENQFEHILNNWMLNRNSFYNDYNGKQVSINSGVDILFSRKDDVYAIPAGWNDLREQRKNQAVSITVPDQIVSYRGGLYFYAPSISFFTKLKLLPPANPRPRSERDVTAGQETTGPFLPGTEREFKIPNAEEAFEGFKKGYELLLEFE